MLKKVVSEIQIIPVKPQNGLVAFSSFVLYEAIYCASVAIFTRPNGDYRLVYPTKKAGAKDLNIFHPINSDVGYLIEQEVIKIYEKVTKNDRHSCNNNT